MLHPFPRMARAALLYLRRAYIAHPGVHLGQFSGCAPAGLFEKNKGFTGSPAEIGLGDTCSGVVGHDPSSARLNGDRDGESARENVHARLPARAGDEMLAVVRAP